MGGDSRVPRGLDGLTAAELNASRRGWWDDAFTDLLLRRVPADVKKVVDVGCGLATAAHALLPKLSKASYVGVDADERRLHDAARLLVGVPYSDRVELQVGRAEGLPCPNGAADFVLTSMTLQHLPDPGAAVRDIGRVLSHAGVYVAIEPDNTNNLFYFDGTLEEVTSAFRDLFREQRRQRRPADTALGPAVARVVEHEKLAVREFFPYVLGRARKMTAHDFFTRLMQTVDIIAAGLPPGCREVESCRAVIGTAEAQVGASATGYGCQLVPVFVCVATAA